MSKRAYQVVQNSRKSRKSGRKTYYLITVHEDVLNELGKKGKTKYFRDNLCKIKCTVYKRPELYQDGKDGLYIIGAYSYRDGETTMKDYFPVIVSDKMLNINEIESGTKLEVIGQLGSWPDNKSYLVVYAAKCKILYDQIQNIRNSFVYIQGYISKPAIYSVIAGKESVVMNVKLNEDGKEQCILCLAWSQEARIIRSLLPGDKVKIYGNLQSYSKIEGVHKKRYVCVETIDLI